MVLHATHVLDGLSRANAVARSRQAIGDCVQPPSCVSGDAGHNPPRLISRRPHGLEFDLTGFDLSGEDKRIDKPVKHARRLA